MTWQAIDYDTRGHVGIVTLNRPEKLNAISGDLRADVHAAFALAQEDDNIRAVILTGAGRGFCSGADLTGQVPPPEASQNARLDEMSWVGRWAKLFHDFDKPLIGAINGSARGPA
uniref:Enoyl-CoA hydratase/isomerase family protein n=1 Tax=Phenylobacterium glaciei TaxID=2803784 RepID=A0A974P3D4_9CAUL|nr:enoyl-CoA hydratase/isomerase family protein [Phenylobacterium glaciei]